MEALLADPAAYQAVFTQRGDPLLRASPFLVFAVAVHQTAADVEAASFVPGTRRALVRPPWRAGRAHRPGRPGCAQPGVVPAGVERMPLRRFTLYTIVGSSIYNLVLIGLGDLLGSRWQTVEK
jgi:hypothetical protein